MLGSEEGSFTDLASLCQCVKASCMLPGVAGVEPPWLKGSTAQVLVLTVLALLVEEYRY
jgi:hypothetical protein